MPSSEFRKRYATLTQTTIVTVNGHDIGTWTPGPMVHGLEKVQLVDAVDTTSRSAQAKRDDLLRKINRG